MRHEPHRSCFAIDAVHCVYRILRAQLHTATSVKFNNVDAKFSGSCTAIFGYCGMLSVTVPAGPSTGYISVTTSTGTLYSDKPFYVRPVLTNFSPVIARVGSLIAISGKSLSQTTAVTFAGNKNGVFTVVNDNLLKARVPASAISGRIIVTTKGGHITSLGKLTVKP